MAEHIIDAFVTKFILDRSDYIDGEKDVEAANKRLRENQHKTFDDIKGSADKAAEGIIGVSRAAVGLGLAFMGAKSIIGFAKDMAVGAASADRFGQTLGMNIKQVIAWQNAMKSVGGEAGEGNAALQRIQAIRMGLRTGNVDPSAMQALGRLGVGFGDLSKGNAGDVLRKLAGASNRMDPQMYSSLLQQVGLPQSTIYFLQQGQAKVDQMLSQFEKNADNQKDLASETEKLQNSMTRLQSVITEKLIPPLTTIADFLNRFIESKPAEYKPVMGSKGLGDTLGFMGQMGLISPGATGAISGGSAPATAPHGRPAVALSGNNPGGINDGSFARSQPGYVGSNGRYAAFATMEHGIAAQAALLGSYVKRGFDTPMKIAHRWAPAGDRNNPIAYAQNIARQMGIGVNDRIGTAQIGAFQHAQAMAENSGYARHAAMARNARGAVSASSGQHVAIGSIVIHTNAKNAQEIARTLPPELRRRGVIMQADRVIAP